MSGERAAEEMQHTARLAQKLGVDTVVGFTGSSIWPYVAMFPPVPAERIEAGYQDFADRWNPILDVFDECGVRFAHEVHPSEIAYDHWSTVRTLEAIDHRPAFGLNWDPSHMVWQGIDPVAFITDFADRIYHVDCKDTRMRMGNGRNGILSSHLPWGDPRRGWDFVSAGRGDVPWEDCFRALRAIGYDGPISVEWEDAVHGPAPRRPRGARLPAPLRLRPALGRVRLGLRPGVGVVSVSPRTRGNRGFWRQIHPRMMTTRRRGQAPIGRRRLARTRRIRRAVRNRMLGGRPTRCECTPSR